VELDVHDEQVLDVEGLDVEGLDVEGLDVEGVAQRAAEEQPATGDREDQVGLEAVGRDLLGELPSRGAEGPVGQDSRSSPTPRMVPGAQDWAPGGTAGRLAA
jgi:hypothetical protein